MAESFSDVLSRLVKDLAGSLSNWLDDFDRSSYITLVDCLKKTDSLAVREAVDQLVREGNLISIPPIYLASQKHPSQLVRKACDEALRNLDPQGQVLRVTQGKSFEEGMHALVDHFGNYQSDPHNRLN